MKEESFSKYITYQSYIQRTEDYYKKLSDKIEKNSKLETIVITEPPSLKYINESEYLKKFFDSPMWLHGIDIYNPNNPSELRISTEQEIQSDANFEPTRIWIAGWDGLILHSNDDGVHWITQETPVKENFEGIDFVDGSSGWVVGHNGVVLKTDNAGSEWNQVYHVGPSILRTIDCIDAQHCWTGGEYNKIFWTENGGKSWHPSAIFSSTYVRSIMMLSADMGFAVGQSILKTEDGGRHWASIYTPRKPWFGERKGFFDIHTGDRKNIWAVGTQQLLVKSSDGGQTWYSQTKNVQLPGEVKEKDIRLHTVHAFDEKRAVVAGINGLILATADGGNSWWPQIWLRQPMASIYASAFRNRREGWAVGNLGHVFGTASGGDRWKPIYGAAYEVVRLAAELLGEPFDADAYKQSLNKGDKFLQSNRYSEAISEYNIALGSNPIGRSAYVQRAKAYRAIHNEKAAIEDLTRSIEIDPGYKMGYLNRGLTYVRMGELSLAKADYEKAIEIDPQYAVAYNNRGIVYLRERNYDAASHEINKAIELSSKNPLYNANRCMLKRIRGELESALSDCNIAIELSEDFAWGLLQRAQVYRDMRDFEQSFRDFSKVLDKAPPGIVKTLQGFMQKVRLYDGPTDGIPNDQFREAMGKCIRTDECYFPAQKALSGMVEFYQ